MRSYLTNRLQRCKINISERPKIFAGVPQVSILGSLLYNIFICDIFLFLQKCDLANYAYDSTKCSFMLLGADNSLQNNLVCGDEILKNTKQEKVLGVTLDNKLNFATHLLNITKSANKKFNALTPFQKYMTTDQKKLILSSFIKSHFTYCPLIWMFCTKRSLRRIKKYV